MTTIVPFLRPELPRQRGEVLALRINGTFPGATPSVAYEGRLQVVNSVGDFQILNVTGTALPPGSDVYADNGSDEIVLRWPAYSESAGTIPNGDFSTGTLAGWTVVKQGEVPGFPAYASVSASRPPPGETYSAFWQGNKGDGSGHAGGVGAVWENNFVGVCAPGRSVTASAQIALDDTNSSQNRGRVRIHFYNVSNVLLNPDDEGGNIIRGNDEAYQISTVTRTAPPNTAYAKFAVWTTANASSGSGVRFGSANWNLPEIVGTNTEANFTINICVRDSAGRVACMTQTFGAALITWRLTQTMSHGLRAAVWAEFSGQRMLFVAGTTVGGATRIYKSTDDGETFAVVPGVPGAFSIGTGAFGNGCAVMRQDFNQLVYTTDGITWTLVSLPNSDNYYNMIFDGAQFMTLGAGGGVLRSTNGIAWTYDSDAALSADVFRTSALIPNPTPGLNGRIIGFSTDRIVYTDNAGVSWTIASYTDPLPGSPFGGATYVPETGEIIAYKASGLDYRKYSSIDRGVTWTNALITWPNTGLIPIPDSSFIFGNKRQWLGFSNSFDVVTGKMFYSDNQLPPYGDTLIANWPGGLASPRGVSNGSTGFSGSSVLPGIGACLLAGSAGGQSAVVIGKSSFNPEGDPYWSQVQSLLHFNGPDTSTSFPDDKFLTWAPFGSAQIDTAQSVFGGGSGLFDGNGDYIYNAAGFPNLAAFEPFTLEFRVRLASLAGTQVLFASGQYSGTVPMMMVLFNHSGGPGKLQFVWDNNQAYWTTTLAANQWYTVSVTRDATGLVRMFLDGVQEATASGLTTGGNMATNGTYIGCAPPYGGAAWALNGWMDEFRFTKGVARYVAGYTPATAEFPNF